MTETPKPACKCAINVHDSRRDRPVVAEIEYCPTHAAAPELLAALEGLRNSGALRRLTGDTIDVADAAITVATGRES